MAEGEGRAGQGEFKLGTHTVGQLREPDISLIPAYFGGLVNKLIETNWLAIRLILVPLRSVLGFSDIYRVYA